MHPPNSHLPTEDKARKALPIFDGCLMYFPDALLAVSEVSRIGNEQHNPGEPLHWARGKSMDQFNTGLRHQMDHRLGVRYDSDGARHLAKAAWRILAALQLDIEAETACRVESVNSAIDEACELPVGPVTWVDVGAPHHFPLSEN